MNKLVFFLYAVLLLLFVGFSYVFVDPGLFYFKFIFTNLFQTHRAMVTACFVLFLVVFFFFYGYFYLLAIRKKLSKEELLVLIGITCFILFFSYPAMVSFDIFNYIATAKVTFFYHENPYILMPINFTHDPLLLFMHAANKTALYAPVWILLTAIPYLLGFGNFYLTLIHFKLLTMLFYIATVWLLWNMTKDMQKTVFFGLNPLVIFECLTSAHNDIVMVFLLLLSVKLFFDKKLFSSSFFYLLSAGIKYATLIALPTFFVASQYSISKRTFFLALTISMYAIFFLSSFREEIYPWYAIWFLLPTSFLFGNNLFSWIGITFSFSLLLRYIPFMLIGTYFGPTPFIKITLTFVPVVLTTVVFFITQKQRKLL